MSDLSWFNPKPHAIAVYASRPLSPVAAQHSLPSGRHSLLGPDFHRLDRTSLRLAHSFDHLIGAALFFGRVLPGYLWLLSADQRAATFLERAEGFRARDGGARLVEVAGVLRLGGLLHLEQIGVLNLTSVGAHHTLAEQAVVGRQLLHRC